MIDIARQYVSKYVALSDEEFSTITKMLVVREFDKKQQVSKDGEVEQYLNFVAKGLARKFFFKNKDEIVTHIAREGEFVCCYESYISCIPSVYVVETIEPTTFISISKQNMEDLYLAVPKVERLARLVITQQFIINEHWDHDRMRKDSQERFISFIKDNADLLQRVPQKYLASYLNIKPETFSRMKHLLKTSKA
ncbi:MAG: Crp/Fnr family transcriptional regulator [Chitinophagales bacterium]